MNGKEAGTRETYPLEYCSSTGAFRRCGRERRGTHNAHIAGRGETLWCRC